MFFKKLIKNSAKMLFYNKMIKQNNKELFDKTIEYNKLKENLLRISNIFPWVELLSNFNDEHRNYLLPLVQYSKSQLGQDLLVALNARNLQGPKFFVEFGATDGIYHSNTWLLEKKLGWSGILAEPCKSWHSNLFKERNCKIDIRCVAAESGNEVEFLEVEGDREKMELSVISNYANIDCHLDARANTNKKYNVKTISLADLLEFHGAPEHISYLSIDTEGSEFDIIKNFDFTKYQIDTITIEHNFKSNIRDQIHQVLSAAGYERILCDLSKFDDWYVFKKNLANTL